MTHRAGLWAPAVSPLHQPALPLGVLRVCFWVLAPLCLSHGALPPTMAGAWTRESGEDAQRSHKD